MTPRSSLVAHNLNRAGRGVPGVPRICTLCRETPPAEGIPPTGSCAKPLRPAVRRPAAPLLHTRPAQDARAGARSPAVVVRRFCTTIFSPRAAQPRRQGRFQRRPLRTPPEGRVGVRSDGRGDRVAAGSRRAAGGVMLPTRERRFPAALCRAVDHDVDVDATERLDCLLRQPLTAAEPDRSTLARECPAPGILPSSCP